VLLFEKNILILEKKIKDLRASAQNDSSLEDSVRQLEATLADKIQKKYKNLSTWEKVEVARHPERPKATSYINHFLTQQTPISGDRLFSDDQAIVCRMGFINQTPAMVIGQERGHDTQSRIKHNFGMPKPEGYRKAQRAMQLAERMGIPVVTLVDTPGAYPGPEAENRGQAEAIARCVDVTLSLRVPVVSVIIGEGGSGGALALTAANTVFMLEQSVYSVISPEGCASILWRDSAKKEKAAEALQCSAQHLYKLNLIDAILPEPIGGAHRHPDKVVQSVKSAIHESLLSFQQYSPEQCRAQRREKFLSLTRTQPC